MSEHTTHFEGCECFTERLAKLEQELKYTRMAADSEAQWANELKAERDRYKAALEKIRDGGVADGVFANGHERMLAMCDIATEALEGKNVLG